MNMISRLYRLDKNKAKSDHGLTLIECLVAIVVIAVTSATIAPVMVLSVATRVQNQKAEQALLLAQGEIDRVRLVVESNSVYTSADLKLASSPTAPLLSAPSSVPGTAITTVGPPTSFVPSTTWSASGYTPSDVKAREIDTNRDNLPDFVIQSFRGGSPNPTGVADMPVAFDIGVRVYDYSASKDNLATLETNPAGLGFTSGEGQRGRRPLAVLYTQIINSDNPESLCQYMAYLRASVPATMSCN